jgi:hypothetical protein
VSGPVVLDTREQRAAELTVRLARVAGTVLDLAKRLAADLHDQRTWHWPRDWRSEVGRVAWLRVEGQTVELWVGSPEDPTVPNWLQAARQDGAGPVKWHWLGSGPTQAERDLAQMLQDLEGVS